MMLPHGAVVAVADGEKLHLYRNAGDETDLKLQVIDAGHVGTANHGGGARHQSSSANPDASQSTEDGFAAGVADILNKQVLSHKASHLVVIAAPRTLGEMRKHYHKQMEHALIGEIAKDLTGRPLHDIEKALHGA